MLNLELEEYHDSFETEWDEFVLNSSVNGTIFHTRNFLNYHEPDRFEDRSLMIYNEQELVCVIAVCRNGSSYFSHLGTSYGGPVVHSKYYKMEYLIPIVDAILEHYDHNIGFRISENIFSDVLNDAIVYLLARSGNINLELGVYAKLNEPNLVSKFSSRKQREIRQLLNKGFRTRIASSETDYKQFHKVLVSNLMRHNVSPTHNEVEFIRLSHRIMDSQLLILGEDDEGNIVSGGWIIKARKDVWHLLYAMKDYNYPHNGVIPCTYLRCMEEAKKQGARYLNFGISTEQGGKNMNIGLFNLKEMLGGETINRYLILPNAK